jgi:hypothetical protein
MTYDNMINRHVCKMFNETNALLEEDRCAGAVAKAREFLADSRCPRHHRMKGLLLLPPTVDDWAEADDRRIDAKALWFLVRRWHLEGEDAEIDRYIARYAIHSETVAERSSGSMYVNSLLKTNAYSSKDIWLSSIIHSAPQPSLRSPINQTQSPP